MKVDLMRALIAALLFCPNVANATFNDGNELLEACQQSASFSNGFASGVIDTLLISSPRINLICPPIGVTVGQAKDVMCKFLESNPAIRHQAGASLAWQAFYEVWPCPR